MVFLGQRRGCAASPAYRFHALPEYLLLRTYGREGVTDIVQRNCKQAAAFKQLIKAAAAFRPLAPCA